MITDKGMLYIEPQNPASEQPVIDELTRKMAGCLRSLHANQVGVTRRAHLCLRREIEQSRLHCTQCDRYQLALRTLLGLSSR